MATEKPNYLKAAFFNVYNLSMLVGVAAAALATGDYLMGDRARTDKLMESLPEREWARAHALDELRREIERDMQQNPSFQAILLQTEIDKLGQLHMSFVKLAYACLRAETYLQAIDTRELDRQLQAQKTLGDK